MALVKVANAADLPTGQGMVVEVNRRELALFNVNGDFYCIDNTCPHMDGPLGEGELDGDAVMCPWHAWSFNVRTGEGLYGSGLCVQAFDCKVEDGEVFVEI